MKLATSKAKLDNLVVRLEQDEDKYFFVHFSGEDGKMAIHGNLNVQCAAKLVEILHEKHLKDVIIFPKQLDN